VSAIVIVIPPEVVHALLAYRDIDRLCLEGYERYRDLCLQDDRQGADKFYLVLGDRGDARRRAHSAFMAAMRAWR
jgi:hypothetical protein